MRFLCTCGYTIYDSTDELSYKGSIIADQDMNELYDLIESIKEEKENIDDVLIKIDHFFHRKIYQCPTCGSIYIEDISKKYELIPFTPLNQGDELNKKLLMSKYGKQWKGRLYAWWHDQKREWEEYHGVICPHLNVELDDLDFDDYELFYKRFMEIMDELIKKDLLLYAQITKNDKSIFQWEKD